MEGVTEQGSKPRLSNTTRVPWLLARSAETVKEPPDSPVWPREAPRWRGGASRQEGKGAARYGPSPPERTGRAGPGCAVCPGSDGPGRGGGEGQKLHTQEKAVHVKDQVSDWPQRGCRGGGRRSGHGEATTAPALCGSWRRKRAPPGRWEQRGTVLSWSRGVCWERRWECGE